MTSPDLAALAHSSGIDRGAHVPKRHVRHVTFNMFNTRVMPAGATPARCQAAALLRTFMRTVSCLDPPGSLARPPQARPRRRARRMAAGPHQLPALRETLLREPQGREESRRTPPPGHPHAQVPVRGLLAPVTDEGAAEAAAAPAPAPGCSYAAPKRHGRGGLTVAARRRTGRGRKRPAAARPPGRQYPRRADQRAAAPGLPPATPGPRHARRLPARRHRERAQYADLHPGLAAIVNLGNRRPRGAAAT